MVGHSEHILATLPVSGPHVNKNMKLLVSIVIGVVVGVIGARFLFVGSALSLIPWSIVGLVIGWWSKPLKGALVNGGLYGFFLAFSFMAAVYQGSAPIVSRIPFFATLGLVGAVCGLILSVIGNFAKKKLNPHNKVV